MLQQFAANTQQKTTDAIQNLKNNEKVKTIREQGMSIFGFGRTAFAKEDTPGQNQESLSLVVENPS